MHPLAVSLEDLYLGKELKVSVPATSYEKDPTGSVMDRAGNRYNKKLERVLLDVTIDKGMQNGQRLTFEGKGNTMPGTVVEPTPTPAAAAGAVSFRPLPACLDRRVCAGRHCARHPAEGARRLPATRL